MKRDSGEEAASLAAERKTIDAEGAEEIRKALERGGFDARKYRTEHKLVPKG
jgi:hypothetical protein